MAGISFTVADFVATLRQGHFASDPLSATGLVKIPEEKVRGKGKENVIEALEFAHGSDCTNWVSVPLKFIDRVDFLRVVRCKDHSHPLVTLIFSIPESEEAKIFAAIAKVTSTTSSNLPGTHSISMVGAPISHQPTLPQAFFTTFNMPSVVAPDANGNCPWGYHACSQGCCRDLGS